MDNIINIAKTPNKPIYRLNTSRNIAAALIRNLIAVSLFSFVLCASAHSVVASAQTYDQSDTPKPLWAQGENPGDRAMRPVEPQIKTTPGIHLVLNGGVTFGGDTIITAVRTDGTTDTIKGGELLQIGIGGLWQFENVPIALLMSANYHTKRISATNGEATFNRYPVEVLAYYTGIERFRIGGGVRIVNSPEATTTINGVTDKATFDKATGLVAEIGYHAIQPLWINFRAVSEKYQGNTYTSPNGSTTSLAGTSAISGNHVGINFIVEF